MSYLAGPSRDTPTEAGSMTTRLRADAKDAARVGLPPQLARVMRPELPDLAEEIIAEVRSTSPE